MTRLEHVNVTVSDCQATAKMLATLFGWRIRWEGDSIYDGYSMHVGEENSYIAIYSGPTTQQVLPEGATYNLRAGLNHIAVVVDDLDAVEEKVIAYGLTPQSHANYEPGRRFYFDDPDGIEFEVVEYDS